MQGVVTEKRRGLRMSPMNYAKECGDSSPFATLRVRMTAKDRQQQGQATSSAEAGPPPSAKDDKGGAEG